MIKKEGKYPVNARIDVNYINHKPNVKFSYTTNKVKKQARDQNTFSPILFRIFIIWLFLVFIYVMPFKQAEYPTKCLYSPMISVIDNEILGFNMNCDTGNFTYLYANGYSISPITKPKFMIRIDPKDGIINLLVIATSFFALLIINKFILTPLLVKSKWYQKWYPKHQAKTCSKEYYKFTAKDVENNMVEIPKFSNVILDYKTTGDFNKYLEKIRIREHKSHKFKLKRGSRKIGKLKRNEYAWYARFFFSQKPVNGYLEVIYH